MCYLNKINLRGFTIDYVAWIINFKEYNLSDLKMSALHFERLEKFMFNFVFYESSKVTEELFYT